MLHATPINVSEELNTTEGDIEIYLMDVDGSNERRLTNGIGASMQPAFSPDSRLLYIRLRRR